MSPTPGLAKPKNPRDVLRDVARARAWTEAHGLQESPGPLQPGETSSATLTSLELSTNTPAQVARYTPMQRCLLLLGTGPARLACSATCRQQLFSCWKGTTATQSNELPAVTSARPVL